MMLKGDFVMVLVCFRTSDQNLEETGNKNVFPIKTKRITRGQSNLIGTRTEERLIVTKNRQQWKKSVIVTS